RGDGGVALGRKAVGDRADVAVDAKDLLQHHDRAARTAGRGGEPRLKLVPVAGHDGGVFAHAVPSMASPVWAWHSNARRTREESMLVGPAVRRVAIVGGLRIPFARAYTAYANATNQDMLTAVLRALVERYKLQGERLGDVAAGAVIKHTKDYNLV